VVLVNKPVALLRLASAAMLTLPLLAQAAGLGRLTVQSFLGQPLRAEIEIVSLQPGEESSLEARLASGNAFAQAGIEFNPVLTGIQFALDKRGGKPMIRVSTRQPVNEPFVDLLVELRWATGLFVREYTVLLDPPGYEGPKPQPSMAAVPGAAPSVAETAAPPASKASPPPAAAPAPTPSAETKPEPAAVAQAPAAESTPAETAKPEAAREEKAAPAMTQEEAPAAQPGQTYEVQKGDTLGEIALQYRPQGVSYHQMLIALQRANEDAFIRSNVNLVRAGAILSIPDAESAAAVEARDATRLVIAQNADFDEYRGRLGMTVAAAPAAPQAAERSAAGPITAKPEAPKPAAATDQLKLSRADAKKPGAPAAKAAREDDLAARERALKEAQSRVAELEKNVSDLQKLLEIRNQQLAQVQQKAAAQAAAPVPAPAPAVKAPEPPKPAPAPQAVTAPEVKPAAPTPPPAPPAPSPAAQAPKPAPPAAKPQPRPMTPPPPEPGLLDEFVDNPAALGGLAAVVLLLAGYGAWAWRRKKKSVGRFQDSVLGPGSIEPGAASLDVPAPAGAAPASAAPSSVSQAPAGMGTDDVDPIAEADVYMAYGRDAQAEEILKEALQRDPNRIAVMAKLLEIYANRRDAQSFEPIALKLKSATHGAGPDWDKATALGRSVDPGNGLYGGAAPGMAPAAALAAAPVVAAAPAPSVDFDIGGGGSQRQAEAPALDLDLGGSTGSHQKSDFAPSGTLVLDTQESKAASSGLDFDLGGGSEKPAETGGGLNFQLPGAAPAAPEPAPEPASGGLDFDLNMGSGETKEASAPVDLSAISLDLGTPGESAAPAGDAQGDPKWQEVATKLDLAKAYEEMGDKDGARELLNEVLREGDAAQQGQANQLLAKLG